MKKFLIYLILLVSLCSCADIVYHRVEKRRYTDTVLVYDGNKLVSSYTGHVLERFVSRGDYKTVVIMYIEHNKNYTELRFPKEYTVIITVGNETYQMVKGPSPFPGEKYRLIN